MKPNTPIRIAVVIPKYGLVGGGEKFVVQLTERIAASFPCEIHVFANQWKRHSELIRFHKVPIVSFPKYLTTVSFAWFAQRRIEKMGFDLVHAHERLYAADIVSLHSIPHRLWVRDVRKKRFFSLFDRATIGVEKAMVLNNSKTLFLPVSGIAHDRFVAEYPDVAGRIEVLHPGVDMTGFERVDRNQCRANLRRQFGFRETDTVLLFVGMNFELKGLDQVIAAMGTIKSMPSERSNPAILMSDQKSLKLFVVGKGNRNKYQKMARNAGVGDDVCFSGVRTEKMEEVYLAADFYAMPSAFDTFGMTVLEAMAASLPVIISPNVGAKDLVQEGVNGFIVAREDIDAVSRSIMLLLDPKRRTEMGINAHRIAQDHTWDVLARKVMERYKKILAGRSE